MILFNRYKYAPIILILSIVLFMIILKVVDRSQNISDDPTGLAVNKMISAAIDDRAEVLYPYRLEIAKAHLEYAKDLMRYNLKYLWGFRDFEHSQEAMDTALAYANRLFMRCNQHQLEAKELSGISISGAEIALETSKTLNAKSLASIETRRNLARAEMLLNYAKAHYARKYYDEALKESSESKNDSETASKLNRKLLSRFYDHHYLIVWKSWVDTAISNSKKNKSILFIVSKQPHTLQVYKAGVLVSTVPVDLGANWIYPKLYEGDRCTPEGKYKVIMKNANSKYHKALLIDYPNVEDKKRYKRARRFGEIPSDRGIGNLIEIHGNGGLGYDWSDGCVAVSDTVMDELYQRASVGTEVIIVGNIK
jgi:L,D-peptidoglycan transpeptidase YkuD (ErfK/YbiS/YcfS/YnhG family)